MSKVYIAKQAIGRFKTGEVVEGLTEDRAEFLLSKGAIEAVEGEGNDNDTGGGDEVVKLDKLTKAELTALLDEEEIEYNESDTKAELIALFPKE
ncbi:hypothetical protein [uncultured Psychrobacter sp.]|uniref:hypothetical protein n=1 Tax=uncultured Psychrobacter sp. TaxID=259303 RepID=UPI0026303243|nr:hypothetical protein [uncultured Psychrobacter sp.]